ncbi:MAG: hypothetical protein ACHQET_12910 [Chitinophagales bacterium]
MAKLNGNPIAEGLSGSIGRMLTFRQIGGKTFISKYQRTSTVAATEKLVVARTRFGQATAYAKRVIRDPSLKALYLAFAMGGQRVFNVAIRDALNPPRVESIRADIYNGKPGDPILIRAIDDFKVVEVRVSVHTDSGELVEEGKAVMQENKLDWLYIAISRNPEISGSKITAIASDLPGNRHSMTLNL